MVEARMSEIGHHPQNNRKDKYLGRKIRKEGLDSNTIMVTSRDISINTSFTLI